MDVNKQTLDMLDKLSVIVKSVVPEFLSFSVDKTKDNVDFVTAHYVFGSEKCNVAADSPVAALRDILKQIHD